MRKVAAVLPIIVFALVLNGCTVGIVYQHTVQPLTVNHHATLATGAEGVSDIKHIQFPYVGVMWGDTAFGGVAREKGVQELYYADLEYLSVLGIWRQSTVHLYGK